MLIHSSRLLLGGFLGDTQTTQFLWLNKSASIRLEEKCVFFFNQGVLNKNTGYTPKTDLFKDHMKPEHDDFKQHYVVFSLDSSFKYHNLVQQGDPVMSPCVPKLNPAVGYRHFTTYHHHFSTAQRVLTSKEGLATARRTRSRKKWKQVFV